MTMPIGVDPVAGEVNARIRAQARKFEIEPGTLLNFMCECGCMTEVATTVSAYDAASGGIFASGHRLRRQPIRERIAARVRLRRRTVASVP